MKIVHETVSVQSGGKMDFWAIIVLVVTVTVGISSVSADWNSHEDASSIATWSVAWNNFLKILLDWKPKLIGFWSLEISMQQQGIINANGSNVDRAATGPAMAINEMLSNQVNYLQKHLLECEYRSCWHTFAELHKFMHLLLNSN